MKPNILLIGCGKFGKNHLRVLKQFDEEGKISLKGVITATEESRQKIAEEHNVDTFPELTEELLESVDAVDITTPADTHFNIIKQCIKHADMLVEKPLALSMQEIKEIKSLAQENDKKVMVGHIFRFNNAVDELKKIVALNMSDLQNIKGKFVEKEIPNLATGAIFEFLHLFDVLEYILEKNPDSVLCEAKKSENSEFEECAFLKIGYGTQYSAELELGKKEGEKERSFLFEFKDMKVYCDMLRQVITITGKEERKIECFKEEPLKIEIERFINLLNGSKESFPDINTAINVQKVIDAAYKSIELKSVVGVEQ